MKYYDVLSQVRARVCLCVTSSHRVTKTSDVAANETHTHTLRIEGTRPPARVNLSKLNSIRKTASGPRRSDENLSLSFASSRPKFWPPYTRDRNKLRLRRRRVRRSAAAGRNRSVTTMRSIRTARTASAGLRRAGSQSVLKRVVVFSYAPSSSGSLRTRPCNDVYAS